MAKAKAAFSLETAQKITDKLIAGKWIGKAKGGASDVARCFPALLVALKWRGNWRILCEALPYDMEKMDVLDLRDAMVNIGFKSTPHHVHLNAIDPRLLPCLFIPDDHDGEKSAAMVVLGHSPSSEGGKECVDVFDGVQNSLITYPAKASVAGKAYFFQEIEKEEDEHDTRPWFLAFVERFSGLFTYIFLASFLISLLALAPPIYVMLVYDKVIGAQSTETLYYFFGGAGLFVLIEFSLRQLRARMISWFGSRLDYLVGVSIFEKLCFLPAAFTERASVSSQIARIKAFDMVRDFFTGPLFLVFLELPFLLVTLTAISIIAGPLVFLPLIGIIVFMIIISFFLPRFHRVISLSAGKSAKRQEFIIETFARLRMLKTMHTHDAWLERFRQMSGEASHSAMRSSFYATSVEALAQMVSALVAVSMIYFGVSRIWEGDMTVGALVATMILVWRTLTPMQNVCGAVTSVEQVFSSVGQINRLMAIQEERKPHSSPVPVEKIKGEVQFARVGIRYTANADPVFTGLNFRIKPGEFIAVTGKNGSGKTTILKLINGLYQPQMGAVMVDGIDIRQIDPIELRQHIVYMPQHPEFFKGTLADNLRLVNPFAKDEEIEEALVKADVWEEVSHLPNGINTMIDEEESQHFSSSFLLHLGMARMYLSHSKIMLLDELPYVITQSESGETFRRFLRSRKEKDTVVLVTHDPNLLEMADRILLLRRGENPRMTNYDSLMKMKE